jgi:hypothetical protein
MATTTYKSRARRALLLKDNSTFWGAIGRVTAWDNEASPPDPSPASTAVEETICYVQASLVALCTPVDDDEDVTVLGQKYAYVADEDAIDEGARFIYVKVIFDPSAGQPYDTFRQIGLFSDLVPSAGYESETWLAPENVDSSGLLEYLSNEQSTNMSTSKKEIIEIVIENR